MTDAKLLIVADDLTGGLDTGVQFARQGISTRVVVNPDPDGDWVQADAQVLVAVAETRHMPPEAAYDTVFGIVSAGRQGGIPYIYKKTDSALRGNIGAELSAALKASGNDVMAFLPAYPAMNRVTVKGRHYIDGVPVAQSVFGKDPFNPVQESNVQKLIGIQTDTPVTGEEDAGKGILVVDAQSDEDLKEAGERLSRKGYLAASAGCAGFAAFLPDLIGLEKGEMTGFPDLGESLLVISGSLNPVTIKQLDAAEENGFMRICPDPVQEISVLAEDLSRGKWVILDSSGTDPESASFRDYVRENGLEGEEVRVCIASYLAEIMAEMPETYAGTVMVIGGDTLLACLERLGCKDLEPVTELFPGVVLSRYRVGNKEKMMISKSGGFGSETLLSDLRRIIE